MSFLLFLFFLHPHIGTYTLTPTGYVMQNVSHTQPKSPQVSRSQTTRTVRAKVTAYSPTDDRNGINADSSPHTTSTGTRVHRGEVAVDPRKIPYGTKLYIPGYGNATAEDTGGAIRNYKGIQIDLYMDTYDEAMAWGVRYLDVEIKE